MVCRVRRLLGGVAAIVVLCAGCASGETGVVTTYAGKATWIGSDDGPGPDARFSGPTGVAVDAAGNLYVADSGNGTIRKITAARVVTTLAGTPGVTGSADGTGAAAQFRTPTSVAVDGAGTVYVADTGNGTIRKISPAGVVTTLAGTPGVVGWADGTGADAKFASPAGVAVDSSGTVYVADTFNDRIRKISPTAEVTTWAGSGFGTADGIGSAAQFYAPRGLAVDGAGTVYVGDTGNSTIRRITPAGVVTTWAGWPQLTGTADGTGPSARFDQPRGVAFTSTGSLYIAEWANSTIREVV